MRQVILLCGPPGAGKTTAARASGLLVLDRDDPQWVSEGQFLAAMREVGARADVRAVVIRSAPSSAARRRWAEMIRATHVRLVLQPVDELHRRVRERSHGDVGRSIAGVDRWLGRFDEVDAVARFTDWSFLQTDIEDLGMVTE